MLCKPDVSLFVAVCRLTHILQHKLDNIINGFTDQDSREQLKTLT